MDKKSKIENVEKMSEEEILKNRVLLTYHSLNALMFGIGTYGMAQVSIEEKFYLGSLICMFTAYCSMTGIVNARESYKKLKDNGYSFKLKK